MSRVELTEQKHLDLIALHHAVFLQLVLNLLIALLPLLLLCAHTTTHFGELGYRRTKYDGRKECRCPRKRSETLAAATKLVSNGSFVSKEHVFNSDE